MDIISMFEIIANNAHHRVEVNELLADQSDVVRQSFCLEDASLIRGYMNRGCGLLADKSLVVNIKNFI